MTSNMYMCDTNDVRNFQIAKGNTGLPGSFSESLITMEIATQQLQYRDKLYKLSSSNLYLPYC